MLTDDINHFLENQFAYIYRWRQLNEPLPCCRVVGADSRDEADGLFRSMRRGRSIPELGLEVEEVPLEDPSRIAKILMLIREHDPNVNHQGTIWDKSKRRPPKQWPPQKTA